MLASNYMERVDQAAPQIRIAYEWTEDFLIKYLWSAAGYCLISIPVFITRVRNVGVQAQGPRPHEKTDNEVANRTESKSSLLIVNHAMH